MVAEISRLLEVFGCDDLSTWPQFEFTIGGGQLLKLQASSYVASYDFTEFEAERARGEVVPSAHKKAKKTLLDRFMPHLASLHTKRMQAQANLRTVPMQQKSECGPAIFSMPPRGPGKYCEILFGLPMFRDYYVSHKLRDDGRGDRMMFSKPDSKCQGPAPQSELQAATLEFYRPPVINPNKIRFPRRFSH